MKENVSSQDHEKLIAPLYRFDRTFWIAAVILAVLSAPGLVLYVRQLVLGLGVTDLNRPVFWGIYLVNFIFLIGVSMAGTVISAVLQLLNVKWRRPITRIAEALTVFGLLIAGLQILMDMGRPDRFLYTLVYGRFQAPLLWDILSLMLYLLTAIFALYLQLLPDLALLRDNVPAGAPEWRRKMYKFLAMKWSGSSQQYQTLKKFITAISFVIVPIGVSLHTVTSWLFSTTVQPGWKSTILGPYFVVGAIFSGIGLLFVAVTYARRVWKLEKYFQLSFYKNLGWIFIVMSLVWFYFTLNETLVVTAEHETLEFSVMASKLFGESAPTFWGMILLMTAAVWILVAPKLIPDIFMRAPIFQPHFARAFGAGAMVLIMVSLVMPYVPQLARLDTGLDISLGGIVLLALTLMWGVSITTWLKAHPIGSSVIASIFVLVGMWLERWNIMIPTLTHPRLIPYVVYTPTITEIGITISMFALMGLMFIVFFKFFPAVSIWEVCEGQEEEETQAMFGLSQAPLVEK